MIRLFKTRLVPEDDSCQPLSILTKQEPPAVAPSSTLRAALVPDGIFDVSAELYRVLDVFTKSAASVSSESDATYLVAPATQSGEFFWSEIHQPKYIRPR